MSAYANELDAALWVHAEGAARRTVRTTYANYGTRIEHDNARARLIADSERELFAQAIQLAQGN